MSEINGDSWDKYRRLVMDSIERLTTEIREERNNFKSEMRELYSRLFDIEKKIASLEVRCGLAGLIGGAIPVTAALLTRYL
ncbi:MAG: hypothetical protein Unbinned7015contig1001_14 [Prokaryotic dsDNA virus sp.]|nr:MAG: hypothetical protein Unbinned7015contig1001_14 [Prokaryotic dsDNA virus sp.]|tara:strand:- start:16668 stop:16910 length:243 start_codon:yes stop_codon:yes gene_type:complete